MMVFAGGEFQKNSLLQIKGFLIQDLQCPTLDASRYLELCGLYCRGPLDIGPPPYLTLTRQMPDSAGWRHSARPVSTSGTSRACDHCRHGRLVTIR